MDNFILNIYLSISNEIHPTPLTPRPPPCILTSMGFFQDFPDIPQVAIVQKSI
jgi:hypothetical protein